MPLITTDYLTLIYRLHQQLTIFSMMISNTRVRINKHKLTIQTQDREGHLNYKFQVIQQYEDV